MAFSLVISTSAAASFTTSTSAIDTTGADLLVVCVNNTSVSAPVSDSKSNTWTKLTGQSGTPGTCIYYSKNPTVGSSHTFTVTGVSFVAFQVLAFSGADLTSPFDVENGNSTTGTTLQPGSVTPSANGSLLVVGLGSNQSEGGVSIDSSFTIQESNPYTGGTNYGGFCAYKIQGTASAENPTWTMGTSRNYYSTIAVFAPASGGSSVSVGLASNQDTALGMTWIKSLPFGLSSGQDTALVMTWSKDLAIGLSSGQDTALTATWTKDLAIGLATGQDTALAMTYSSNTVLGIASEQDTALTATWAKDLAIGLSSEQDTALANQPQITKAIGLASGQDTALSFTATFAVSIGLATEQDTALASTWTKVLSIGLASEQDLGLAMAATLTVYAAPNPYIPGRSQKVSSYSRRPSQNSTYLAAPSDPK